MLHVPTDEGAQENNYTRQLQFSLAQRIEATNTQLQ